MALESETDQRNLLIPKHLNMKKLTTTLVFLAIFTANSFSQDLPQIKHKIIENVVEEINIFNRNNRKNDAILTSSKSGDTLVLEAKGKDNVILKYTFKLKNGRCDFQSVDYECSHCAEKNVMRILNQAYLGWRKLGENKYLSNYFYQTELELIKNEDGTIRLVYQFVNKTKKEYKLWYKTLPKI
jgi:hypothetical protein